MSKPAKKFNWLTTLRRLAKRKTPISANEHKALRLRADRWLTCACGQLCSALDRYPNGSPLDSILRPLGYSFNDRVREGQWKAALEVFLKIEARTTLLLKQMAEAGKAAA